MMEIEVHNKADAKVSVKVNEHGVTVVTIDPKPKADMIGQSWANLENPHSYESKIVKKAFDVKRKG